MKNVYKLNEKGKEYFKKQANKKGEVHVCDINDWSIEFGLNLKEILEGVYVLNKEYDSEHKNAIGFIQGFIEGLKYRLNGTNIFVNEYFIDEED